MKKFRNVMCFVLVFAMLICGLSACASKPAQSTDTPASDNSSADETPAADNAATDGEITIAFIGNTTGDYAQYGIPVRNAVMLYFDQLNANGGINGKKVVVKEYDDKGDGVEAVNAYNLAKENGITAVVGSVLTGTTIALADATYEDNMPQITASATAAGVTVMEDTGEVRTNVFRACFIDPFQGQKMAEYAAEKVGAKTAAVFYETGSDYSGEAGLAITAARQAGCTAMFLGGDGFGSVKDYASAEDLEGTVYCSGYAPGTDSVAQFEKDYCETFDVDEVPNMFAPLAYDAAMLMAYGLKAAEDAGLTAGTEEYKQAVIDAIKTMSGVEGITGTYSFDDNNNPIKSVAIIELTGGEEVFKEMY